MEEIKIERLDNYNALLENNDFKEIHKALEEKIIKIALKEKYKRIQFGTIADFYNKKLNNGKIVPLTTMTLARLLKR